MLHGLKSRCLTENWCRELLRPLFSVPQEVVFFLPKPHPPVLHPFIACQSPALSLALGWRWRHDTWAQTPCRTSLSRGAMQIASCAGGEVPHTCLTHRTEHYKNAFLCVHLTLKQVPTVLAITFKCRYKNGIPNDRCLIYQRQKPLGPFSR